LFLYSDVDWRRAKQFITPSDYELACMKHVTKRKEKKDKEEKIIL